MTQQEDYDKYRELSRELLKEYKLTFINLLKKNIENANPADVFLIFQTVIAALFCDVMNTIIKDEHHMSCIIEFHKIIMLTCEKKK